MTADNDGAVHVEHDGAILRLTLDRPQRRNALSHSMIDSLVTALSAAAYDDSLRAIAITGTGEHFCTGADWVATNAAGNRPRTGDLVRRIPHTAHRVIELLVTIQLPMVATMPAEYPSSTSTTAAAFSLTTAFSETAACFWLAAAAVPAKPLPDDTEGVGGAR